MAAEGDVARLVCPFCGAPLTDRIRIDGEGFLVFRCMFTPRYDPGRPDEAIAEDLKALRAGGAGTYFRGVCDKLHLYVTQGAGARELSGAAPDP